MEEFETDPIKLMALIQNNPSTYTVKKLHQKLETLIAQGHGDALVAINTEDEDGYHELLGEVALGNYKPVYEGMGHVWTDSEETEPGPHLRCIILTLE